MLGGISTNSVVAADALVWPVPGHKHLPTNTFHAGNAIDITDGSIGGAKVVAAKSGKVTTIYKCGQQHYGEERDCHGFGTGLVIYGDDGRYYQYAHMQPNSIPADVYYGAYVSAGQTIGAVGTTGNSKGYHLHFGIALDYYWNASGINPDYETYQDSAGSNPPAPQQTTWTNSVTEITETNAKVSARITVPSSVTFQWAGCNFFDKNGNMIGQAGENVVYTGNYIDIWYNISQETWGHLQLKPGIQYYYQFYVNYDGVDHFSPKWSFKTKGTHTHTYQESITKKATCTTDGSRKYTCTCAECGYSYTDVIKASGHSWNGGSVTKNATCTTAGVRTYTCTKCKTTKMDTINATGHHYTDKVIAPTTTSEGYTLHICSACGDSYKSDYRDPLPNTESDEGSGEEASAPVQPAKKPATVTAQKKPSVSAASTVKPQSVQPVGTVLKNVAGVDYKVTGRNTTEYIRPTAGTSSVYIPAEISVNGVTYQVTSIAANAFKNNKKLKKVTIGENIRKIGAKAFYGCKKLKNIYIKTGKLKKKSVGSKAFSGINKKAVFKISDISKVKSYKKILRSKRAPSTAKCKFWISF